MLKIYNTLDAVPEGLREHYKLVDGRYIPELSDDHPVLVHNKTLLTEKSQATAKVKELEADIETAKSTSVPRGHVAVAKADAELIDKFKALGKIEDVQAKLTEFDTLKTESTNRKIADNNRLVAQELGFNTDAFLQLTNLPEFEIRDKDGKKTVVAKVKDGETVTEKPAKEFIESTYAPLMPALQAKAGVELPVTGGSGGETQGENPYKWAVDFGKEYAANNAPVGDVMAEFNKRQSA